MGKAEHLRQLLFSADKRAALQALRFPRRHHAIRHRFGGCGIEKLPGALIPRFGLERAELLHRPVA